MRKFAGPVALVLVAVAMFFGIKLRYGSYNNYYYVKVDVPRAGQLLRVGNVPGHPQAETIDGGLIDL